MYVWQSWDYYPVCCLACRRFTIATELGGIIEPGECARAIWLPWKREKCKKQEPWLEC